MKKTNPFDALQLSLMQRISESIPDSVKDAAKYMEEIKRRTYFSGIDHPAFNAASIASSVLSHTNFMEDQRLKALESLKNLAGPLSGRESLLDNIGSINSSSLNDLISKGAWLNDETQRIREIIDGNSVYNKALMNASTVAEGLRLLGIDDRAIKASLELPRGKPQRVTGVTAGDVSTVSEFASIETVEATTSIERQDPFQLSEKRKLGIAITLLLALVTLLYQTNDAREQALLGGLIGLVLTYISNSTPAAKLASFNLLSIKSKGRDTKKRAKKLVTSVGSKSIADHRYVRDSTATVRANPDPQADEIATLTEGIAVRFVRSTNDYTLIEWQSEGSEAVMKGWVVSHKLRRFL